VSRAILAAPTGRHRKPSRRRRIADRLRTVRFFPARRRARLIEEARDRAYVARIAHHEPPPLVVAWMEVQAITAVLVPAWEPLPAATGPVPAAMAAVDGDRPWEYATGQFPKIIAAMGDQDASATG
jgi:hypothetical protein